MRHKFEDSIHVRDAIFCNTTLLALAKCSPVKNFCYTVAVNGVSVKAGLWTGPWTGLWTGLGLDFVVVLPPIAAYSSEMLVPSRKLTASHHCGIEELRRLRSWRL